MDPIIRCDEWNMPTNLSAIFHNIDFHFKSFQSLTFWILCFANFLPFFLTFLTTQVGIWLSLKSTKIAHGECKQSLFYNVLCKFYKIVCCAEGDDVVWCDLLGCKAFKVMIWLLLLSIAFRSREIFADNNLLRARRFWGTKIHIRSGTNLYFVSFSDNFVFILLDWEAHTYQLNTKTRDVDAPRWPSS